MKWTIFDANTEQATFEFYLFIAEFSIVIFVVSNEMHALLNNLHKQYCELQYLDFVRIILNVNWKFMHVI